MTIKPATKKIKFQLKCMTSEKFPEVSFGESIKYLEVSAKDFKEMIQQTIFAVSTDDTRIFMNGVYVEKMGDKLIMVATDGRRLSYVSREIFQGAPEFPSAIVPTKILTIVLKRASSEGNLFLAIENNQVYFKFGSYQFASVLIEGKFPDYRRVIPEGQDKSFEIDKGDFADALKRVGILVEQKTRKVLCEVQPGCLTIQASESELGSADEEILCDYDGPATTIGFNYIYLDEPLKVVDTKRVRFEFTESMKPVVLKPVPDGDYFHVIMPMQAD
jgi:DNA polymerase-3 subunit beta